MYPIKRNRRLRSSEALRSLVREQIITPNDFIVPLFIVEGKDIKEEIPSMPDYYRMSLDHTKKEVLELWNMGLKSVLLFVKVPEVLKDNKGTEAINPKGLMQRAISAIKEATPEMIVMTDVALDPYSSFGHDGIVENNQILNDTTVEVLAQMALSHAQAGADIVAPSDMMDGRIKVIRETLEKEKFKDIVILSYSSKFSSNFYSPFRDALGSKKNLGNASKSTYQINFKNKREAIKESLEDQYEGADMLMVKPAMYYLDIINELKKNTFCPVAAYQVSGEYSMIKHLSDKNIFNYKDVVLESLYCIKRAGADIIFTYFAKEVAKWLK